MKELYDALKELGFSNKMRLSSYVLRRLDVGPETEIWLYKSVYCLINPKYVHLRYFDDWVEVPLERMKTTRDFKDFIGDKVEGWLKN